jgi:O-antigen/teichoic acid export membrane protein
VSQEAPGSPDGPAHRLPDLGKVSDRRVAATAIADLAARVATVALGIVTTALLARHLGASGFAAFNYAVAWGLLFAPLTDFGLRQAAVNRLSVREVSPSEIAGSLLLLRAIMAVVFGSLAAVVAVATAPDDTVAIGSLIVCFSMILGVPSALAAVVQTAMKPAWTIINNASSSLAWTAVALIMIAFDAGPIMLVAGITAAGLLSSLIQAWLASKLTVIGRPTRAALSSLLRLSLPLGLGAIAVAVYYRVDSILVYQISGSEEAGYYAAAYRLVDQVQIIPIAIVGALFPLISEAAATNPERLRRFVASAWEILIGLALPIVAIGIVLAHPLAGLLFGGEFRAPTGTVLILIWPVVIAIFLGYLGGALVPAVNLVKVWTVIAFAGAALSVGLCLLLIPPLGANGAALATVATEFPVMAATLWIACRRAKLRLPVARPARMLAAAALAGGAAALLGMVSLFLGLIGGGLAYVLLLQLTRVVDIPVLVRAIRRPREIARSLG